MGQFVVGDDLRENSALPLKVGASWAKAFGEKLLLLHGEGLAGSESLDNLLDRFDFNAEEKYVDNVLLANAKAMQKQWNELPGKEGVEIHVDSRPGKGAEVLLEQAKNADTELLALGYNPKRTLREAFLGTVTEEMIHKSSSSVMIVKNDRAAVPENVMVAYDFSHHCDEALEWAKRLSAAFDAKVHLVNVVPCYFQGYRSPEAAQGELNRKIEEMISENIHQFESKLNAKAVELREEDVDIKAVTVLDKKGSVSDKLVEYAREKDIDLILTGSHMRGKIKELLLGSVASALIKKSPCSILVAK